MSGPHGADEAADLREQALRDPEEGNRDHGDHTQHQQRHQDDDQAREFARFREVHATGSRGAGFGAGGGFSGPLVIVNDGLISVVGIVAVDAAFAPRIAGMPMMPATSATAESTAAANALAGTSRLCADNHPDSHQDRLHDESVHGDLQARDPRLRRCVVLLEYLGSAVHDRVPQFGRR